jgi:hypothetical protein
LTDSTDLTARLHRAVIYAADPHDLAGIDRCLRYVRDRRYLFAGIVTGPDHFEDAQRMLDEGQAQVLVMGGCGDVPPQAVPRWELVSHEIRHRRRNEPPADDDTQPVRNRLRRPRPI